MFRKSFLFACPLIVLGLLTGCGSSQSAEDDSTAGALTNGEEVEAPEAMATSYALKCDLKNDDYKATAQGEIQINAEKKLVPGTKIKMKINSFPEATLEVKEGTVTDLEKKQGSIVLVWKKLGAEVIEATMTYDGTAKKGSSKSKLGEPKFDADCTFTK